MEDMTVIEQMDQVRLSGRSNMLDMKGVRRAASDLGLEELVVACDNSTTYAAALMRLSLHLQAQAETNPAPVVDMIREL